MSRRRCWEKYSATLHKAQSCHTSLRLREVSVYYHVRIAIFMKFNPLKVERKLKHKAKQPRQNAKLKRPRSVQARGRSHRWLHLRYAIPFFLPFFFCKSVGISRWESALVVCVFFVFAILTVFLFYLATHWLLLFLENTWVSKPLLGGGVTYIFLKKKVPQNNPKSS